MAEDITNIIDVRMEEPLTNFKLDGCKAQKKFYAAFFKTSAEFLDPKPTQLHIACSIDALRPMSRT
jgi:hypothetical protein